MFSTGWTWLYIGAFLMVAELVAPGFVIFFFGLSAATVGVCRFVVGPAFTLAWQLAAFSFFSFVYLLLLRRWVTGIFMGSSTTSKTDFENENVGRIGTVTESIKPPLPGRVMLGDAEWSATADAEIPSGADVKVVAQDSEGNEVTQYYALNGLRCKTADED